MTSLLERVQEFTCSPTRMDILPLSEVLNYESCDHWSGGPVHEMLDGKREDPWYPRLLETILREGFTKGIRIDPNGGLVTDGHHRIAVAVDLGMSFIPVETWSYCEYDSSFFDGFDDNYDEY